MPIIHLLRHGHVYNPDGILYGRLSGFGLSDSGRAMADAVAEHLVTHGHAIVRVVSSPLERAQQTAEAISTAYRCPVETDNRLIESGNSFEGERMRPLIKFLVRPKRLWSLRNPCRPSWGEPYIDIRDRMMSAILDAAHREPEGETVLISHQQPIWITRLAVEGRRLVHDPRGRTCSPASLTSLTVENDRVVHLDYIEPASHIEVPR